MEPSKVQTNEQPREQFQYMIGGVPVLFPCKPYPSQIAMMAKVRIQLTMDSVRIYACTLGVVATYITYAKLGLYNMGVSVYSTLLTNGDKGYSN